MYLCLIFWLKKPEWPQWHFKHDKLSSSPWGNQVCCCTCDKQMLCKRIAVDSSCWSWACGCFCHLTPPCRPDNASSQHLMILMTWLDSQCSAEAKSKLDIINVGCSLRRIQQVLGSWNMMSTASQWGRVGWCEKVWFPGCERNQPDCSETPNQKIVPDVTSQNMDNMDNQLRKVMFHTSSHSNVGGLFFVFRYEPTKSRPTMVLPVTFHTFLFWLFLWEV